MQQKIRDFRVKYSFYLILSCVSVYYFIFLGEPGCAYSNDSMGYVTIGFTRFPVYPLLFQLFLKLFGQTRYLLYMTYFQGILAVFSVMFLLIFLKKQFQLRKWETVLIYLALILPYGIDTLWDAPRFVYTHYISTEGITYSLYYIFIACLLHFLLNQQRSGFFWCLILIPVMCCTRTQLMICYPVVFLAILYVYRTALKKIILSAGLILLSVISISLINNGYHWYFQGDFEPSSVNEFTLFANMLFIADREDAALIENEDAARLFSQIYEESYALEYHYDFAPDSLIGLADKLIDSHDKIKYDILYPVMREYTASLGIESEWQADRVHRDLLKPIVAALRQDNFGKWLHTCLTLVPEALMLSFNPVTPPQILGLLYAYALFMSAAISVYILGSLVKNKKFTPPLLALSAVFVLLMTNAAGLSFSIYAISRYTNYNLGLIYAMLFLCIRSRLSARPLPPT